MNNKTTAALRRATTARTLGRTQDAKQAAKEAIRRMENQLAWRQSNGK